MSETETLPVFETRMIEPDSNQAKMNIDQTTKTVKQWQKAYNEKNSGDYLSCYADSLKFVHFIKPDWRIVSKEELGKDVLEKFFRLNFSPNMGLR